MSPHSMRKHHASESLDCALTVQLTRCLWLSGLIITITVITIIIIIIAIIIITIITIIVIIIIIIIIIVTIIIIIITIIIIIVIVIVIIIVMSRAGAADHGGAAGHDALLPRGGPR